MSTITEIAPDIFRINTYFSAFGLGFSQFLVVDDEPLLFHTGMRSLFPDVREAVAKLIDPATLRWIGFSHFEADECGAINEWRAIAPEARGVCSMVGKMVSVDDFVGNDSTKGMENGEVFATGTRSYRFIQTPHVPHCWDAGMLFEETTGTLFCSDLLHQNGDVEALTESDIVDRARQTMTEIQAGPLANYFPYTERTASELQKLVDLRPKTLAVMHGSVFVGDGGKALSDYGEMLREVLRVEPANAKSSSI